MSTADKYLDTLLVTHNGNFQADEVLAIVILQTLYPHARVLRTRDEKEIARIAEAEPRTRIIICDLLGRFDPDKLVFDHHYEGEKPHYFFRNGAKALSPMSSVGLVFNHFKSLLLPAIIKQLPAVVGEECVDLVNQIAQITDPCWMDELCDQVYARYIHEIDAIDSGIFNTDGKYKIFGNLSSVVSLMNNLKPFDTAVEEQGVLFKRACDLARHNFFLVVASLAAQKIVCGKQIVHVFTSKGQSEPDICVYKDPAGAYAFNYKYRFQLYRDDEGKACIRTMTTKWSPLPDLDAEHVSAGAWMHHNKFLAKFSTVDSFSNYLAKLILGPLDGLSEDKVLELSENVATGTYQADEQPPMDVAQPPSSNSGKPASISAKDLAILCFA